MIIIKSDRDIEAMREAGAVAATVLEEVASWIQPGITTKAIDDYAATVLKKHGARSAFLGYRNYPCQICVSVNEQVVHGLAGDRQVLYGDIVSLDVGVYYCGFVGDTACTIAVGGCDVQTQKLLDVTENALHEGIAKAIIGNRVVDISRAIQNYVESNGYNVVREFVGHGVGRSVHEDPQVPNYDDGKTSPRLRSGMTLAIEPMVNAGSPAVKILDDGWTVITQDGLPSAHFEHTVLITETEPEVLTCRRQMPSRLKAK